MAYCYEYPRPAVTVDILLFCPLAKQGHELLLIARKHPPYEGHWALPGGFVDQDEDLPDAATRELQEETALTNIPLKQLQTFGKPGRDPRGHTVSVVYWAIIAPENKTLVKAGDDAAQTQWFPLGKLPPLAFDHKEVIDYARNHLPIL